MDYRKLVNDARRGTFEEVYYPIDVATTGVVAVRDSSFANVDKNKTKSQADWVLMLVDNANNSFFTHWEGRATLMRWRSRKLKRRVRSTLAAETMAATEAVKASDILRAHIAEVRFELDLKKKDKCLQRVPMAQVTDSRSLHDLLSKRGSAPEEQRLLLDIEAIRERAGIYGLDRLMGEYEADSGGLFDEGRPEGR